MSPSEEKIEGKKFAKAVTEERAELWDRGLAFDGSTLPPLVQKEILKDWLLSDLEFKEVCLSHGLSEEEAQKLEERLPPNILAMRKAQNSTELALVGSEDIDKNREIIFNLLSDGLRLSRMVRLMADLMFRSGSMKPKDILNFVSSWDKIVRGIGNFIAPEELRPKEGQGLKALMELTSEALGDLKMKIKEYRKYKIEIPDAEVILEKSKEKGGE